MTAILALLSNLFGFLQGLWAHLRDRRLVKAGEDKAKVEGYEDAIEIIKEADAARSNEPASGGVRQPPPYKRNSD